VTARLLATLVVLVVLVGIVVGGYVMSRRGSTNVTPGEPDRVTGDVVTGLMAELRKVQAEAAYWKTTAERLQREADER
jgi:hypothetical protein